MSISLTEDVKTMTELENQPRKIVDQIHQTGRPVVVTSAGKPDLIIMDAALYERQFKTANLIELLVEAEANVKAGQTRPFEDFMKEFRHSPGRDGRTS